MMDFEKARENMIKGQLVPQGVQDAKILESFGNLMRERFVSPSLKDLAYSDRPLELAPGRMLLAPHSFARLLQIACISPSNRVLDVGSGSGYSACILSKLTSCVVALESEEELYKLMKSLLKECAEQVVSLHGPLEEGAPSHGPFDVIVLEGAVEDLPASLIDQLAEGGRCIGYKLTKNPHLQQATLWVKGKKSTVTTKALFEAYSPPLKQLSSLPPFLSRFLAHV